MGSVEILGQVDVFQYWPNGSSDVDTLKFLPDLTSATYISEKANVKVGAFFERGGTFLPDDNKPGEEKFRSILRTSGGVSLSVRLQGIDAPEFHYSPNFREGMFDGDYGKWIAKHLARQKSYRQPYGKLCTDQFATRVRGELGILPSEAPVPEMLVDAKLTIFADSIAGAVDVFGRVVGYVKLVRDDHEVVVNDFALANGFAFCSFYGSMLVDEMNRLSNLFDSHGTGDAPKSQLRSNSSRQLRDFEPGLWTTRSMRDTDRDDNGADSIRAKCFDPKIFRRCIDWLGRREALTDPVGLLEYMQGNDEEVVLFDDFARAKGNWGKSRKFAMGSLIAKDGSFNYEPGEVVFESRLVDIVDSQRQPLPKSFLQPYP